MSLLKRRVVKDTVTYTLANYIAMAIGILVGVVTKAILGTMGAGYWALLKVFTSYGEYSDLGTRNAMNREIPRVMGAGKQEEALKTQDSAYAFMLLASFAVLPKLETPSSGERLTNKLPSLKVSARKTNLPIFIARHIIPI